MSVSVGVYDHSTGANEPGELIHGFLPLLGDSSVTMKFDIALSQKGEMDEQLVAREFASKKIVVAHFADDTNWQAFLDESKQGSIRVRTATDGRAGQPHVVTGKGVVVLNLQCGHASLTRADWKVILMKLAERGVALGTAKIGEVPSGLERYFGLTKGAEILSALAILCQGSLAVQCGPDDEGEVKLEVTDPTGKIAKAITTMQWKDALASECCRKLLDQRLTDCTKRQGRDELRKNVSKPSFWDVFDEKDSNKLIAAAEKEWNGLRGKGDIQKVKTLLAAVSFPTVGLDFQANSSLSNFGTLVAEAYLELAKRLKGAS
jgi:hypothetical protein